MIARLSLTAGCRWREEHPCERHSESPPVGRRQVESGVVKRKAQPPPRAQIAFGPYPATAEWSKQCMRQRERILRRDARRRSGRSSELVYFISFGSYDAIKIGYTDNLAKRLPDLQTGNPYELVVIATMSGTQKEEFELHDRFAGLRIRPNGEWFRRECALVHFIRTLGVTGIECDCPRQEELW